MADGTYSLLNGDKKKKNRKFNKLKNAFFIFFTLSFVSLLSRFVTEVFLEKNVNYFMKTKDGIYGKHEMLIRFVPLYNNGTNGPLTINRKIDDGTKSNIYSMIRETNESFDSSFYDYNTFKKLKNVVKKNEEYFCELGLPSEAFAGYYLTCPEHYTIVVEKATFGRYKSDNTHCIKDYNGNPLDNSKIETNKNCIINTLSTVKELCEGRTECNLKPNTSFFSNPCENLYKYLYIKYHCQKDKEMKKQKFAIVLFADNIKPNSIYEHAVSELYQYADVHGYKFLFYEQNYDSNRELFYMKLHSVYEAIVKGLKSKEYDWIFWVDLDILIANPNIKLENFIPTDDRIHLIATADDHGLNASVYLIRVHPWSLNFIERALAYQYYHKNKYLKYSGQTSMNNILVKNKKEKVHYVIVPHNWFNVLPDKRHSGDMLLHFADSKDINKVSHDIRMELRNDPDYLTAKSNAEQRKEVLEYYALPREEQQKLVYIEYYSTKQKIINFIKDLFHFKRDNKP